MPVEIIVALFGVGGIAIGGLITYFTVRRKNNADASAAIANAASVLLEPLTKRVADLEERVRGQECTIRRYGQRVITLMGGIRQLLAQITGLGHTPVWTPDEWDPDKET